MERSIQDQAEYPQLEDLVGQLIVGTNMEKSPRQPRPDCLLI